jgi:hypothetical protein
MVYKQGYLNGLLQIMNWICEIVEARNTPTIINNGLNENNKQLIMFANHQLPHQVVLA